MEHDITDSFSGIENSIDSTHWPDENPSQFTEYQAAMMLWKVYPIFLLVLGSFGNIATIFVMRRIKDHNSSQHAILMSLAVSDLVLLYAATLTEWVRYLFDVDLQTLHTLSCKIRSWLVYVSNTLSAWLVTGVTGQRTVAVIWPHKVRVMCTVRRTWVAIAALVTTAFALHSHFLAGIVLSQDQRCIFGSTGYAQFYRRVFTWVDMCVSSLLPSVVLLVCDVILSTTLFKATSTTSLAVHGVSGVKAVQASDSRKKTASRTSVMILTLSCTFLLLTMPVCVCLLWYNHAHVQVTQNPRLIAQKELAYAVTFLLWFTNSSVNFLLYCLTGTKFRKEFLSWVRCGAPDRSAAGGGEATAGELSETERRRR